MTAVSINYLKRLVDVFPRHLSFAFGYGSGVFSQHQGHGEPPSKPPNSGQPLASAPSSASSSSNMIDLILSVDEPFLWHKENMKKNPSHYSGLRILGPKIVASIQENFGAKVYFNTLVPVEDGLSLIKYGVIKTEHLVNDLLDWDTLYISGRLHKPVQVLIEPQGKNGHLLSKALKINRQNATHCALLLLPESFSEEQLYLTITNLSYGGDFRMIVGEDKNKVAKIVAPQIERFRNIYQPYMTSNVMQHLLQWNPTSKSFTQDCSGPVVLHHLNLLPKNVQQRLYIYWKKKGRLRDLDDVLQMVSMSYSCPAFVKKSVDDIVWVSSWSQSFKSVFTAGLSKSLKYATKKLVKMYLSFKPKRVEK